MTLPATYRSVRWLLAALSLILLAAPGALAQTTDFATGLSAPIGVTQLSDGRILVTQGDGTIASFNADGTRNADFATGLTGPYRILELADSRILVSHTSGVYSFNADGTRNADFLSGYDQPLGLGQLPDGRIIVACRPALRSFNPDGTSNPNLPTTGDGRAVIRLTDGRFLIPSQTDSKVASYNSDGTQNADFASGLNGPIDGFQAPDGRVFIYIVNTFQVVAFDADGTGQETIASLGTNGKTFGGTLLADGRVLATLRDQNKVVSLTGISIPRITLTVAAASPVYWPKDQATVSVAAAGADGLYSLRADLGYDAARLAYTASTLTAGSLFTSGAPQVVDQVFAADGRVEFGSGRTDGTAASGSGTVATFPLAVADFAAPGKADFTLTGVDAIDPTGAPFAFGETSGGSFMVGGVWPGDLDNDCSVGVLDILPIGLYYDMTGPARQGARDLVWGAKAFSPWGGSSASSEFIRSFADSDGNGVIDASDFLAFTVNEGETHDPSTGCVSPAALRAGPATRAARPVAIALEGPVGSTVAFDLALSAPTEGLLGTAVALAFDGTGATVLGVEPGSLFTGALKAVRIRDGVAEAAFTHRGAAEAVSGTGTLVRVLARVNEAGASVSLSGFHLSTAAGGTVAVDPSSGAVTASAVRVVANEGAAPPAFAVTLGPNPARTATRVALTVAEAGDVRIGVYDALGRQVAEARQTVAAGSSSISIPVGSLAPGLYVIRVVAPGGTASRTLTVAR